MPDASLHFADIHCHPHMRSFNWLYKPWNPSKSEKYHPWWIILPKFKSSDKGIRAAAYSQCDLVQVTNGNLKLAIVSLYPMEKGWVTGRKTDIQGNPVNLKKILGDNTFNDWVSGGLGNALKSVYKWLGKDKGGDPAIRDFLQAIYMKLPFRKINFFQSERYDYFKELKNEHEYLLRRSGVKTRSEIFIPPLKKLAFNKNRIRRKCPVELDATGTYVVAKNGEHVREIIAAGKTAFVLSIEGANVFNSHLPVEDVLKNIAEVKTWEEPLFFITFTHHFYNYLAGHAHSIPDVGTNLIDQEEGMNTGFTEKGRKVVRYLLSLDENNNKNDAFGRRILIDVKHLSVVARKEYYEQIIRPCFQKGDVIPVIASHVAYSGREKLKELIDNIPNEKDGLMAERFGHKFNAWNINICDEDAITIFKSGGLIGINLDQRVLGIPKGDQKEREKHIHYVWQNMRAIMLAIVEANDDDLPDKERVVDLLSLGTDFDGYVDPVDKYATVIDFALLRKDLEKAIAGDPEKDKLLFGLTPEKLAEKICFTNAVDFVVKNFKGNEPEQNISIPPDLDV